MENIIDCKTQAGFVFPNVLLNGGIYKAYVASQVLCGEEPASIEHQQFRAPSLFETELVEQIGCTHQDAFVEVDRIDGAFVDEIAKAAVEIEVPPFCRGQG